MRLPPEGREELRQLLVECERRGCWPRQLLGVIGATLPKSAGGERIIGMLPLPPKVWSRARSSVTSSWTDGLGAFWDSAIRGSSALRAALLRAVMDETGMELGVAASTLYMDVDNFYDLVSLVKLMAIAERFE